MSFGPSRQICCTNRLPGNGTTQGAVVGYGIGLEIDDMSIGHSGGDLGFSSDVHFDTETGMIAIIFFAQSDADTGWASDMIDGQSSRLCRTVLQNIHLDERSAFNLRPHLSSRRHQKTLQTSW